MNGKINLFILISLVLAGCSNNIKKDYIITDASENSKPKWVKKMSYNSDKSDYKYFISKSENVNQNLCEKGSKIRAASVAASEIANKISDTYEEVIKNENMISNELVTSNLKQTISLYLAGLENEGSYWEKRNYKISLGANEDTTKYYCYALMKMNKENYKKIIDASINKMFEKINDDNKTKLETEIKNKLIENE